MWKDLNINRNNRGFLPQIKCLSKPNALYWKELRIDFKRGKEIF